MTSQNRDFCYYHPKQYLVGVCPFCLNEKLLVVAAKQVRRRKLTDRTGKEGNNVGVQRMFDLRSLFNRLEFRHRNKQRSDVCADFGSDFLSTSTSLEDSFISIKFEDNGVALWDKSKTKPSKTSQHQPNKPFCATTTTVANTNHTSLTEEGNRKKKKKKKSNMSVVEHAKTPQGSLRWRKRIGHLMQLVRWKRSNKSSEGTSHVDGGGGVVKGRNKGWIRTFTRRRTSKE